MAMSGSDDLGLLAAHIALLVLRTQVPAAGEPLDYIIPPATGRLTAEEAAGRLATLRKPVGLAGKRKSDAILVSHDSLTGARLARHQNRFKSRVALWESAIRKRAHVDPDAARLLFRNRADPRDAFAVSFKAFRVWMQE
jgi:hypothetical protein